MRALPGQIVHLLCPKVKTHWFSYHAKFEGTEVWKEKKENLKDSGFHGIIYVFKDKYNIMVLKYFLF